MDEQQRPKREPTYKGLAGLYAHELEGRYATRQMRILRRLDETRWLVEVFSWLGGSRQVAAISEAALLSDRCVLDTSAEDMRFAYEHGGRRMPDHLLAH